MSNRIFMDVPQVRELADKLGDYSEIQTEKLDKYNNAMKELVGEMEGRAKHGFETASRHINLESKDNTGRMLGFEKVYKFTGENRLLIDEEGAEAAQGDELGLVKTGRIDVAGNSDLTLAETLMAGAAEVSENIEEVIDDVTSDELNEEVIEQLSFPDDLDIDTAEYL
jgi:hypothetical protein